MPKFIINKLVRDNYLNIYQEAGQSVIYKKLSGLALRKALLCKFREETTEYHKAPTADNRLEELADMQEVLDSLAAIDGFSDKDIRKIQEQKRREKGSFSQGIFVQEMELKDSDPWVEYYRNSTEEYEEL
jgi:predicted house-cleaning noncanonical NTP pyrophosphatase (MazG superfamily)